MTTYTDVFGTNTVPPSEQGFSAIALTADATLQWPEFYDGTGNTVAAVMEITPDAGGWVVTLPDSTQVSTGRDLLIRNPGSFSFSLKDNAGVLLTTIGAGTAVYYYLKTNVIAAGTWGQVAFGVGTSSVDAATLVGYGVKAITTTLNQSHPTTSTSGDVTVGATYRAKVLVGTDSGITTVALTAAATLGDDFFFFYHNAGAGTATINPDAAELIDGQATKQIQPGESLMVVCNGSTWYSVGYGRSMIYQFTQLVYDVTAGGPFTLSSSEAANKLITFVGTPGADVVVTTPSVVAVYYLYNNLSTAHSITFKTSGGAGLGVAQTERIIAICDGTYIISAQSVTANTQVSLVNGTVSAPALNFSAATQTGLYLNGASGLGVAIGGVAALLFDNSGNMTTTKTLNGLTISTTTGTLTIAAGKTLTLSKTMQLTAADDTGVYTFPTGTQSLAMLAAQEFTGLQTFNAGIAIPTGQSITGAGTAAITGFASIGATTFQAGSGSTTAAGIIAGYYGSSGYGAIWSTGVSPTTSNYAFLTNGASSYLHGTTSANLAVSGIPIAVATTAGLAVTGAGAFSGAVQASGGVGQTLALNGALAVGQTKTVTVTINSSGNAVGLMVIVGGFVNGGLADSRALWLVGGRVTGSEYSVTEIVRTNRSGSMTISAATLNSGNVTFTIANGSGVQVGDFTVTVVGGNGSGTLATLSAV